MCLQRRTSGSTEAGGWKVLTLDTESAGVNEDVDEIVEAIAVQNSRGIVGDEVHEIIMNVPATPPDDHPMIIRMTSLNVSDGMIM